MRHLLSLALGLLLGPVIYVATGYAAIEFTKAPSLLTAVLGLSALVTAGGCYGVLVLARLSPVGPVLVGLALLGVSIWAAVNRFSFTSLLPRELFGNEGVLQAAAPVTSTVLAVPLILILFSPRRWRRTAAPSQGGYLAAPIYPTAVESAAPTYTPYETTTLDMPTPYQSPYTYQPPNR